MTWPAKGTPLEVKVGNEWVLARVEFRIEQGEPLGEWSFYREDGGGRIVSCLCKTREPKGLAKLAAVERGR